jgi:alpha-methylacyl-CoA racemase
VLQPAPAPRFSRTPTIRPVPPDDGGRDVAATLAAWGFADDDIEALTSVGTVR